MGSTFYKVKIIGNWAEHDAIDKKVFVSGEEVEVMWPDKTITRHKISVRKFHVPVMEQGGSTWDTLHTEAFIKIEHHGSTFKVRLFDLPKIKVRRV